MLSVRIFALLAVPSLVGCTSSTGATQDGGSADARPSAGDATLEKDASSPGDASARDAASMACEASYDCAYSCFPANGGPIIGCCVSGTCLCTPPIACTDASAQPILAAKYDQSCSSDSDCVAVAEGDFCSPGTNNCANAAINMRSLAQYQSDVAKTQAAACTAVGDCPVNFGPCCRSGKCQRYNCFSPSDTLPACADAGGSCGPSSGGCGSLDAGPPDSCAYSDETCCLN